MTFFNARDVVRHLLVQRIVDAYQIWEQNQEQADRNGKSTGSSS